MEKVLLYNLSDTPMAFQLKVILASEKIRMRSVAPGEYRQAIGYLAGLPGFSDNGTVYDGEAFSEPMLVMCGFTGQRLDRLLGRLKTRKLPSISLKAVVTSQNQHWDSLQLYKELKAEHEAMHSGAPSDQA